MKSRKKGGVQAFGFKNFGDHVSADTIVLRGVTDRGVGNKNSAVVHFDFGTFWIGRRPVNSRSEEDTSLAFREFLGTTQTVKSFYSDGAPKIIAVANKMGWAGDTSTPGIPRNNSIIENKVRLVVNGGRSLLLQAGLPSKFWPYATQAFCNGLNVVIAGKPLDTSNGVALNFMLAYSFWLSC